MAPLRSWLALTLLVALIGCEAAPREEVANTAPLKEGEPQVQLRESSTTPKNETEEEEEEGPGFTERVPSSWLRPVIPDDEFERRASPLVRDSLLAEDLDMAEFSGEGEDAQGEPSQSESPPSSSENFHSEDALILSAEAHKDATPSADGYYMKAPSHSPLDLDTPSSTSPHTPQEVVTPSSVSPEEQEVTESPGEEETATRAIPEDWKPDLPAPETEENAEDEEGFVGREPPPPPSETKLWVTPAKLASMPVVQVDKDTDLADFGKFRLADGVKAKFASPEFPDEYPRYVWNTWQFLAAEGGGPLRLSCGVVDLGLGDTVRVHPEGGENFTFHSYDFRIEVYAASAMLVELRSDRQDSGRLQCTVRAGPVDATEEAETVEEEVEEFPADLKKVDLNYAECGKTKFSTRIVGGTEPPAHAFPWLVALQTRKRKKQFCGGTIINERFILTAAHCVDRRKPTGLAIAVAKHKRRDDPTEKIFNVKNIKIHEKYNRATQDRDIAIIELTRSLRSMIADERGWVRPICLPRKTCRSENNCYTARSAILAGWGLLDSTFFEGPATVQYVKVPVLSNNQCQENYAKDRIGITRRMVCAGYPDGGKDSCQGDSGGPMAVVSADEVYTLAGVVSFGKGCALPGYPGVYVRVSEFTDWIRDNTRL
ncbi:uncharacterized protein LOC122365328 [Amphibalanus amphitrite]|uniref:uncharacterized protein LOC122365328 n=1 Tax=Amphibalanus amphitrite TaxID=1232801 RepID=UPI001C908616|nr:uncharacterized protein LOC122365328 [Amphibalanus amphitrite]